MGICDKPSPGAQSKGAVERHAWLWFRRAWPPSSPVCRVAFFRALEEPYAMEDGETKEEETAGCNSDSRSVCARNGAVMMHVTFWQDTLCK